MATLAAENVVELHFENIEGQVRIVPPDRDVMAMSITTAIEACRAFNHQIVFRDQFSMLLDRLGQWINERRDKIARAYLTTRDAGLLFLVVRQAQEYDAEFEDELTSLDLDLANDPDFSHITISVLALPNTDGDNVNSFLSKIAMQFHMNGNRG